VEITAAIWPFFAARFLKSGNQSLFFEGTWPAKFGHPARSYVVFGLFSVRPEKCVPYVVKTANMPFFEVNMASQAGWHLTSLVESLVFPISRFSKKPGNGIFFP
jgi:hypothetical protein